MTSPPRGCGGLDKATAAGVLAGPASSASAFAGVPSAFRLNRRGPMSMRKILVALAASIVATLACAATPVQTSATKPATGTYLLTADRVFDARSEATHAGWAVLVEGDKIAAVGPRDSIKVPADAQTINLPGIKLLPGLIDAHSHIFLHLYNVTLWNVQGLKQPLP